MKTLADNVMLVVQALTRAKKDGLSFYELQQATRLAAGYLPGILHMLEQQGWLVSALVDGIEPRSGFGTCANELKRPLDFDTSLFHTKSRLATAGFVRRPTLKPQGARQFNCDDDHNGCRKTTCESCAGNLGDL